MKQETPSCRCPWCTRPGQDLEQRVLREETREYHLRQKPLQLGQTVARCKSDRHDMTPENEEWEYVIHLNRAFVYCKACRADRYGKKRQNG